MKNKIVIAVSIITVLILIVILLLNHKELYAYLIHKDEAVNIFKAGKIEATVTEPNYERDNRVLLPNEEITKDPTFTNTGDVKCYIRAQVYVPVSSDVKYVDEDEKIVVPSEEIELLKYDVNYNVNTNKGWEEVTGQGFKRKVCR